MNISRLQIPTQALYWKKIIINQIAMILAILLLTSIFVAGTALCAKSSFHIGLLVNNPAMRARVLFNVSIQAVLILAVQFGFSLFVTSYQNGLPILAVSYSVTTFFATIMIGIYAFIEARTNVRSIKENLSTLIPTKGGFAPVMDVEVSWKDEARISSRIYNFMEKITIPSIVAAVALGLWWGLVVR